jgi:hypothetical protein
MYTLHGYFKCSMLHLFQVQCCRLTFYLNQFKLTCFTYLRFDDVIKILNRTSNGRSYLADFEVILTQIILLSAIFVST